jgi:hypothetical protein
VRRLCLCVLVHLLRCVRGLRRCPARHADPVADRVAGAGLLEWLEPRIGRELGLEFFEAAFFSAQAISSRNGGRRWGVPF